jgi:hypothetical protein
MLSIIDDDDEYWKDKGILRGKVEIEEKTWEWQVIIISENKIGLELEEPDGTSWRSTCGYCYGAGHMD